MAFLQVSSQNNLIPNGDFEDYKKPCYQTLDGINRKAAFHWFAPTLGTSDWYSECGSRLWNGVPKNNMGECLPQSGSSYAGFIAFYTKIKDYKEYISVELKDSLRKSQKYVLRFYLALAQNSNCYTNNIGALFTEYAIQEQNDKPLECPPSLLNSTLVLNQKGVWVLFEQVYTARGGEKFLTIGNFIKTTKTNVIPLNEFKPDFAYYYIDNVSLLQVTYEGSYQEK